MNFTPFTGHIPTAAAIPTIHQFAAKFGYENNGSTGVVQETRYQSTGNAVQFAVAPAGSALEGGKFRPAESVVVVSAPHAQLASIAPIHTVNAGVKYQTISASSSSVNVGNISYGAQYVQDAPAHKERDKRDGREEYHDIMQTMMQQQVTQATGLEAGQQLVVVLTEGREAGGGARAIKHEPRLERALQLQQTHAQNEYIIVSSGIGDVPEGTWQALGGGVADYLSALPLPLHHLLKYSSPDGKRDEPTIVTVATNTLPAMPVIATHQQTEQTQTQTQTIQTNTNTVVVQTAAVVPPPAESPDQETPKKGKKKKRTVKEKKPRPKPGEIRLTTALDGSTLYCCPECHMAYPERGLLEQHLLGHTMERRFICNICNAALKRKDHLTRHKQSHNPERPHICSVCLKAFKRKEQLTLHFVIHSGEKRHICNECGKGFYRKDHLRKHTRSHIARRVKAELSATQPSPPLAAPPAPAPAPAPS